jgi:hypothetical protein
MEEPFSPIQSLHAVEEEDEELFEEEEMEESVDEDTP